MAASCAESLPGLQNTRRLFSREMALHTIPHRRQGRAVKRFSFSLPAGPREEKKKVADDQKKTRKPRPASIALVGFREATVDVDFLRAEAGARGSRCGNSNMWKLARGRRSRHLPGTCRNEIACVSAFEASSKLSGSKSSTRLRSLRCCDSGKTTPQQTLPGLFSKRLSDVMSCPLSDVRCQTLSTAPLSDADAAQRCLGAESQHRHEHDTTGSRKHVTGTRHCLCFSRPL